MFLLFPGSRRSFVFLCRLHVAPQSNIESTDIQHILDTHDRWPSLWRSSAVSVHHPNPGDPGARDTERESQEPSINREGGDGNLFCFLLSVISRHAPCAFNAAQTKYFPVKTQILAGIKWKHYYRGWQGANASTPPPPVPDRCSLSALSPFCTMFDRHTVLWRGKRLFSVSPLIIHLWQTALTFTLRWVSVWDGQGDNNEGEWDRCREAHILSQVWGDGIRKGRT